MHKKIEEDYFDSMAYNSKILETTEMANNRILKIMIYLYKAVLYSH